MPGRKNMSIEFREAIVAIPSSASGASLNPEQISAAVPHNHLISKSVDDLPVSLH